MCRWLAYSGSPIHLAELILDTDHSLIDQSLSARRSESPTNGDGFGIGWYGQDDTPGLYRDTQPAWNDENLHDLSAHIRSGLFLAHIRRATGTAVQRTNCHPFRHGRWLFVHNGVIEEFGVLKRALMMELAPERFGDVQGTTDSELMFHLALTYGLESDPQGALERMAGLVEEVGSAHGVENPLQMTLGLSDGKRLFAVRYSTRGTPRTLYHSQTVSALKALSPGNPRLGRVAEHARVIVSEPLTDMTESWVEIPPSSTVLIEDGEVGMRPFVPRGAD